MNLVGFFLTLGFDAYSEEWKVTKTKKKTKIEESKK